MIAVPTVKRNPADRLGGAAGAGGLRDRRARPFHPFLGVQPAERLPKSSGVGEH